MLEVTSLSKSFDGFKAVNNAGLTVKEGEIVAVIGPNGAGKTTLFNLITGVIKPDSGKVLFKGEDITGLKPYQVCRRGISRSFQVVNVFPRLRASLKMSRYPSCRGRRKPGTCLPRHPGSQLPKRKKYSRMSALSDVRDATSTALSHGERKVLEIAIALGGNPEFLILDEPTAGMSPEETSRCIDLIRQLKEKLGITILFCEHDMEIVFSISDRIMVMVRGSTIIEGTCNEVRCCQEVQDAYLGGSDVCLM